MVVKEDTADAEGTSAIPMMEDDGKPASKRAIIAQEIKFARTLAGNDATMRRRVLKNLKTWLTTRSQSTFGKYPVSDLGRIMRNLATMLHFRLSF